MSCIPQLDRPRRSTLRRQRCVAADVPASSGRSHRSDSIADFSRQRGPCHRARQNSQEGTHEIDVIGRRVCGGARMRRERAGADLSVASHHDDRAVPAGRADRHGRPRHGRPHEDHARPDRGGRERDRRRRHHRHGPGRARGARRLHAEHRPVDDPCRRRRDLSARVPRAGRFRAGVAADLVSALDRRERTTCRPRT